ncbi:predicted protein, partial [Haematococcus lacustris]
MQGKRLSKEAQAAGGALVGCRALFRPAARWCLSTRTAPSSWSMRCGPLHQGTSRSATCRPTPFKDMSSWPWAWRASSALSCCATTNSANGIDELRQRDMLRLDAMMVQLNIRKVLDDGDRPTINIICQKVAFEGMTRFEDRNRLPLGISINFSSYSAKLLTQASWAGGESPASLIAYSNFGENADLVTIDASELADEGEAVSFMAIQRRAQLRRMVGQKGVLGAAGCAPA